MIVWLASYPRSGNTFLRVILNKIFEIKTLSLYNDINDIAAEEKTSKIVGHEFLPEQFDINKARESDDIYYIKTHGYPLSKADKAIYLIRDGREASLSYSKYLKKYGDKFKTLDDVIYGNVLFGSWGRHVSEWNPDNNDRVLLVKFEDLIENPEAHIASISKFINTSPKEKNIPGFDELKNINPVFFRSGKKDSWKKEYTHDQNLAFCIKYYNELKKYGYDDEIPDSIKKYEYIDLIKALSNENSYTNNLIVNKFGNILEEKNHQLRTIKTSYTKKDNELSALNEEYNNLDKKFLIKNKELDERCVELKNARDELDLLRVEISGKEKENYEIELELKNTKGELNVLRDAISGKEKELEGRDVELKNKNETIDLLNSELEGKTRNLEDYEEILIALNEYISVNMIASPLDKIKKYNNVIQKYTSKKINNSKSD